MTTHPHSDDPLAPLRRDLLGGPWQRSAANTPAEQWRMAVDPFVRVVLEWLEHPATTKIQRDLRVDRSFVFAMSLKQMGQIDKVRPNKNDSHFSNKIRTSRPYPRDRVDLARWIARAMAYAPYAPSPPSTVYDRIAPALLANTLMANWADCAARALADGPGGTGRDSSVPEEWMERLLAVSKALSPVSTPWVAQRAYRSWEQQRADAAAFLNGWAHETQRIKQWAATEQITLPQELSPAACSAEMANPWCALNLVALRWSQALAPKSVQNLLAMDQVINFQRADMEAVRSLYTLRDHRALSVGGGRETGAGAPTDNDGANDTPSVGRSRPRRI